MGDVKNITKLFGMRVYTTGGNYFGEVTEALLSKFKIYGLKIRATPGSAISRLVGAVDGVIVPYTLVKAFGDVLVISDSAIPSSTEAVKDEKGTKDVAGELLDIQ